MAERYEYTEGTSRKFWEIELAGKKFTARWGKIGGSVNSNEKSFATADAAKVAADKLVAEKVKKGYTKVGGGGKGGKAGKAKAGTATDETTKPKKPVVIKPNPELEDLLADNRDDKANWQIYADWLLEQGEPWGEMIVKACRRNPKAELDKLGTELLGKHADEGIISWKYGVIESIHLYPEENPEDAEGELDYERTLERILRHPAGRLVNQIDLGLPPLVPGNIHWHFEGLIKAIAAAGPLPLLAVLNMTADAEHMDQRSWRRIGDIRALWKAAPRLTHLAMEGSNGSDGGAPIKLGTVDAPHLLEFEYISSGLDKSVLTDLAKGNLPALTHLELYFGRRDYGNTCTVKSLASFLETDAMPKLEYLGLKNAEWEKDFIRTIAKSSLLKRVKQLDLSLGILYEEGPAALIEHADKFRHLERIDLTDNYIPDEQAKALKKVLPKVDVASQRELDDDDPEYRYPDVGE